MAKQCHKSRSSVEILQNASQIVPKNPSVKLLSGNKFNSSKLAEGSSYLALQRTALHISPLHSSQTQWFKEANHRPFKSQQIHHNPSLLPSISENPEAISSSGILDGQNRHEGCLLPRPNKLPLSEISCLPLEEQVLQFQLPSFRTNLCPGSFSGVSKLSHEDSQGREDRLLSLSGRHLNLGSLSGEVQEKCRSDLQPSILPRLPNQLGKISCDSFPGDSLVRCSNRWEESLPKASLGEDSENLNSVQISSCKEVLLSEGMGSSSGSLGFCSTDIVSFKSSQEVVRSHPSFPSSSRSYLDAPSCSYPSSSKMVVYPRESGLLGVLPGNLSLSSDLGGCVRQRLGSPRSVRQLDCRELGGESPDASYESQRIEGSIVQSEIFPRSSGLFLKSILGQQYHCPSPPKTGVFPVPPSYSGSRGDSFCLQGEKSFHLSSQSTRVPERVSGCTLPEHSPSRGVGNPSARSFKNLEASSCYSDRFNGDSIQRNSGIFHQPLFPPKSNRSRFLVSELEQLEQLLPVSSSFTTDKSLSSSSPLPRNNDSDHSRSPSPVSPLPRRETTPSIHSTVCSPSTGQRILGGRLKTRILSLDRVSFLRELLIPSLGDLITSKILAGKRQSTLYQQNVAWRSFQEYLNSQEEEYDGIRTVLHFCFWLRDTKRLETNTILNYKAALLFPLKLALNLDSKCWEFTELRNCLFLDKPPRPRNILSWDANKVLTLLLSDLYSSTPLNKFRQLKKCLFLFALASGNRVSELSACVRNGLGNIDSSKTCRIAVMPGFLFKNQRLGRSPPPITIAPFLDGSPSICPVRNLISYLGLSTPKDGALFCNSRTDKALHKSSVSKLLCEIINEADPNHLPKAHDVRRMSVSIAWTRGLSPTEITKRAFWRSSNVFIDRYLSDKSVFEGVALNTV